MLDAATQEPAQPTTPCQNGVRARHVQATTAPAACERRALDGAAAFGEAMKREVVKRLRQRSGHTWLQSESRGQVHRLLRFVRCQCDSEGAGLAWFIASAVTERTGVFGNRCYGLSGLINNQKNQTMPWGTGGALTDKYSAKTTTSYNMNNASTH